METSQALLIVLTAQLGLAACAWGAIALALDGPQPALPHWIVFCLAGLAAALLAPSSAQMDERWRIAATNMALLLALVAGRRGTAVFLGRPSRDAEHLLILAAGVAIHAWDGVFGLDPVWRAIGIVSLMGLVAARSASESFAPARSEFGIGPALVISVPLAAVALLFAARAVELATAPQPLQTLAMSTNTPANNARLLALSALGLLLNFSLAYLVVARMVRRLRHLSMHDALTGLLNRRAFMSALEVERRRMQRGGSGCAVLMVDIDHFKRVNDTFGHAAGDAALQRVGRAIEATARVTDVVARLGGEEFCLLARMTDEHGAEILAERVRAAVAAARDEAVPTIPALTVSVGIAVADTRSTATPDELVARADAAMYRAKQLGRDRVELAR